MIHAESVTPQLGAMHHVEQHRVDQRRFLILRHELADITEMPDELLHVYVTIYQIIAFGLAV